MKKILFIACLLLASVETFAQHAKGSFNIQPKVGLNVATMTDNDGCDPRVGFVGGAEFEYQATDVLSLSFGALYSQQGLKANSDEMDGTIKMDYINVPVLLNVYVTKGLAVKAGIQPGVKVNSKVKVSASGASAEVDLEKAFQAGGVDASVKSVDFAIPVGLSYEYRNFQFDARYNFSVTKAIEAEGESTKHSVFQFTIGYKFDL